LTLRYSEDSLDVACNAGEQTFTSAAGTDLCSTTQISGQVIQDSGTENLVFYLSDNGLSGGTSRRTFQKQGTTSIAVPLDPSCSQCPTPAPTTAPTTAPTPAPTTPAPGGPIP
jgi:hypothetical protein